MFERNKPALPIVAVRMLSIVVIVRTRFGSTTLMLRNVKNSGFEWQFLWLKLYFWQSAQRNSYARYRMAAKKKLVKLLCLEEAIMFSFYVFIGHMSARREMHATFCSSKNINSVSAQLYSLLSNTRTVTLDILQVLQESKFLCAVTLHNCPA